MLAFAALSANAADRFDSTIANAQSNLCLAASSKNDRVPLRPIAIGSCDNKWSLEEEEGEYSIFTDGKSQCLDVEGGSKAAGARIIAARCTEERAQRWRLQAIGEGFQISSVRSGLCLAVAGDSNATGAQAVQQSCSGTAARTWRIGEFPGVISSWSRTIPIGMVATSAANLADGRVLLWAAEGPLAFDVNSVPPRTYTAFFDPSSQRATPRVVTETGHNMFCPGVSLLADGTVHVSGGISSTKTSLFRDNVWNVAAPMSVGRGYHGQTTLATGEVFTIGGSWSGGTGDKVGEVWSAGGGWRRLPNFNADPITAPDPEGVYRGDNHAWLFAIGGGRVFHAGPSANMNWIDTSGGGSISSAGARGDDAYSMNGNVVMYDVGRILKLGGAPAYVNAAATAGAHVIDIRRGGVAVRRVASMAYSRTFSNSVVLPTGQVVVIGGATRALQNTDEGAVLAAELWDPRSERFLRLASMATPRPYHSVAILLPDARVLAAGGGLCGACTANHPDVEILNPPYLFKPNGKPAIRPEIIDTETEARHNTKIIVSVRRPVGAFALVRMGAVTHSLNTDQRRIPLAFAGEDSGDEPDLEGGKNNKEGDDDDKDKDKIGRGKRHVVLIPADSGVAIPGLYMLFAIGKDGVPSTARTIRIGS